MTAADLDRKYGSIGRAAGAVALGIEPIEAYDYEMLPESFRSLILFKQQQAILRVAALAADTSVARLQQIWRDQDQEDR